MFKMNLDLTGGQKLQIGFIALVLVAAGFMFFRNTRTQPDMTMNAFGPVRKQVGIDPKLPVSATNPADPAKTTMVTTFGCHDGRLEVTEFTPESGLKAQFVFIPDLHRTSYDFYKNPWAKVDAISDPYKHTLTFAAYSAANNRPRQILSKAEMDAAQLKAEKEVRQVMTDSMVLLETGAKTGSYQSAMYEQVLAALKDYKATAGDPAKDAAKGKAAHKVLDLAMAYLNKLETDKFASVQKYVAGVDGILNADQKAKLGEMSKQLANNRPQRVKSRAG